LDVTWDFPTCYSDFWYYSIGSDTWKRLPDFPGNRSSAYGFGFNGKVYLGGGYRWNDGIETFKDIIEFDPNF
jgi:hypothetical protein